MLYSYIASDLTDRIVVLHPSSPADAGTSAADHTQRRLPTEPADAGMSYSSSSTDRYLPAPTTSNIDTDRVTVMRAHRHARMVLTSIQHDPITI